jgi:glutamine synthetase
MTPKEVIELAKKNDLKMVDLKFVDLPGQMQHFSMPIHNLDLELFEDGAGFDGSSIRGYQEIQESDMLLFPDPKTAMIDPVCEVPTLTMMCDVRDPMTRQPYSRDPRYIVKKAEKYLESTGIADTSFWGPELEFYIFNDIRFDQNQYSGYYFIDSKEGAWNSGRDEKPNLGYKPRYKEGYFPVPPTDSLQDFRSKVAMKMIEAGINIEVHHHEVGTAGQTEFDMKYDTLESQCDKVMLYKYILKNMAVKNNMTITFMPKPIFMDNGSGMHVHVSLWKKGKNIFFSPKGYAQLSETALYFIGGLLKHSPALLGLCAPTTNSYRRLVPGYEAPINLVYSQRNRSACCRIPMYLRSEKAKRIEYRCPDPSANPYLAMAAIMMAGLDGIQHKLDPGPPLDKDIYNLPPEEKKNVKSVPGSLEEVLKALEKDHEFLLKGDVFTKDIIETWLEYKWKHEIDPVRLRPHPYEFYLYYDV